MQSEVNKVEQKRRQVKGAMGNVCSFNKRSFTVYFMKLDKLTPAR